MLEDSLMEEVESFFGELELEEEEELAIFYNGRFLF